MSATLITAGVAFGQETRATAEKLVEVSPDGKYAMRIRFDEELNNQMVANDDNARPANHGLHSQAIESIDLVKVVGGRKLATLMAEDKLGTHYAGVSLLWSNDSKWCAYHYAHPRFSFTTVYQLAGNPLAALAETKKLRLKHKIDVRNEYLEPMQWQKPGVLVLRQQTIGRGGGDGAGELDCKVTQQISASGAVKLLEKKCYDDPDEAAKEFEQLKERGGS